MGVVWEVYEKGLPLIGALGKVSNHFLVVGEKPEVGEESDETTLR